MAENKNISEHESPMRKMVHDSHGETYTALKSLDDAKKTPNSYLVMEGDDGGQIYLVTPITLVKCNDKTLENLLKSLDALSWNDISMANIYYEVHGSNSIVSGGMGGGKAEKELWVHKDFEKIKDKIAQVLDGMAESI